MTERVKLSDLLHFTDKQRDWQQVANGHRYTLVGGRRGGGKSRWLRWYGIYRLIKWAQQGFIGVRVGLFCEDYPALVDRQITKIEQEFPQWLGSLRASKTEGLAFHLASEYGGGVLALRNLEDPGKKKFGELAGVLIDELTQNPERVFHTLRGSLRWSGIEDTFFAAASNPDGIGQKWVRKLWVERDFPEEMLKLADQFAFIQGGAADNPYLSASYIEELDSLPEALRKAWRDGDWYVSFEGLVYSEFSQANFLPADHAPNKNMTIELAYDDGYIDPRAVLFIQKTGTEVQVFDLVYHTRQLPEVTVKEVLDRCRFWFGEWSDSEEDKQLQGYRADLAIDGKRFPKVMPDLAIGSPEAPELRERFRRADIAVRMPSTKAPQTAVDKIRQLIRDSKGIRSLKINPVRCAALVKEMTEGFRYPEAKTKGDNEKPVDADDHACSALAYWVEMRLKRGMI
jgi:hypothetical protein